MNSKVLKVTKLSKIFPGREKFTAVDGISFELQEGEILGFLGPNGAGKTTTIQMLLGILSPSSGEINYFGKDFFSDRKNILQHVSFASTYLKLPGSSTVYENLDIFGRLYGLNKSERRINTEKYLKLFDMWKYKDRKAHALSAGQMTRVMLAKAFLPNPKVVLLDEPTASLDPDVAAEVRAFILQQQSEHKTSMIFTSHNMSEVEEVCDRVLVLKNGSIIADHTPQALAASVSLSKVVLMGINSERFIAFAQEQDFSYQFLHQRLEISINEHQVPNLLNNLGAHGIRYSQISIAAPSLQDYFLQIARS